MEVVQSISVLLDEVVTCATGVLGEGDNVGRLSVYIVDVLDDPSGVPDDDREERVVDGSTGLTGLLLEKKALEEESNEVIDGLTELMRLLLDEAMLDEVVSEQDVELAEPLFEVKVGPFGVILELETLEELELEML